MSYRDRPRIWKTAYYIIHDNCIKGADVNSEVVQRSNGGGMTWKEWAIDLRALCPDHLIKYVDTHYLTPSNDYKKIPSNIKPALRRIWKIADNRGLYSHGEFISEQLMG